MELTKLNTTYQTVTVEWAPFQIKARGSTCKMMCNNAQCLLSEVFVFFEGKGRSTYARPPRERKLKTACKVYQSKGGNPTTTPPDDNDRHGKEHAIGGHWSCLRDFRVTRKPLSWQVLISSASRPMSAHSCPQSMFLHGDAYSKVVEYTPKLTVNGGY
ncbi:hypothetical protein BV22DRAFT_104973 [Leucogyrophana mollusca]|uniref:Uncharacterized protein n=1 Tax=Leucogyrophana mollusca TaxID=85980 RepID=A0ACB8BXA2_9AGAM|nr:hypothetical protein BV22DRAFT_104973 [Leucogyrophana mollusca]